MNKPSIKISRTGSSRNCGGSSIEMVLHISCCNENGMVLEANCVTDFNGQSKHDYIFEILLEAFPSIFKSLSEAALKNPNFFQKILESIQKELIALSAVASGTLTKHNAQQPQQIAITKQSVSKGKVLAKNTPHPYIRDRSTTRLNPNYFAGIEGEGQYDHYSHKSNGDDFGVDIDGGSPDCFDYIWKHKIDFELYEDHDSITVVVPSLCQGFHLPKESFKLTVALSLDNI